MLERFLDRFLIREEIDGHNRCPYLIRWWIYRTRDFCTYLHKFIGNDWSRLMHNHPKRFVSIGLWGAYKDCTPQGERIYRAPWIRTFPASHIHRVILLTPTVWTLVFTFRRTQSWGFFRGTTFIPWREYVFSSEANDDVDC